jgi:hypothetical protein
MAEGLIKQWSRKRDEEVRKAAGDYEASVTHTAQEQGADYPASLHKAPMNDSERSSYDAETEKLRKDLERRRKAEEALNR